MRKTAWRNVIFSFRKVRLFFAIKLLKKNRLTVLHLKISGFRKWLVTVRSDSIEKY